MIYQLVLGTFVITVNAIFQAELFSAFAQKLEKVIVHLRRVFRRFTNTATIVICVLFVMAVQTVNVWVWGLTFYFAGVFSELEPSLYFSLVSFSTLGFGDIVLDEKWRMLSGLAAANGLLSFGWSTAYMVELVRRTQ
ncbi:two pore domain potassium channel family protein [Aestuariivirga litoralis]|uniref:Two pore domain potassium channel family protein n=1 Tax=Aestuariivirga litoralis TaxID=2650924 RepID=A0A2W2AVW2_9HYPH|nr:ion channel [Aestuariivirga litoralis]PZF77852.1 two pore domain potassium channel family protein [Aestuariivirga litoralis]